ncbi:MAG: ferrous iron transport protein B [Myxococcales bacterium]|nr:ferrous iron transport protein B [Myxococcales bacterium]MCB9630103.1 ferrous iron transport protein B [Sandaracinaceae bacterium]
MSQPRVLLAGNPNAGKTTLFNRLTGSSARVGNYPGVTVECSAGTLRCDDTLSVTLMDLPGTYSLSARSPEERVAVDAMFASGEAAPAAIVVVVDALALTRNLYLALQIMETGLPVIIALNMMDAARDAGLAIDSDLLSAGLGVPVIPISATRREGLPELRAQLARTLHAGGAAGEVPVVRYPGAVEAAVATVTPAIAAFKPDASPQAARALALWALLSLGDDELVAIPSALRDAAASARARAEESATDLDQAVIAARYAFLEEVVESAVTRPSAQRRTFTDKLDALLLHRVSGFVVFATVMYVVFEALFSWSEPMVGVIEGGVVSAQDMVNAALPPGALRELLKDGVIAGVGNVIVFVPQIAMLFLMLGFLEDSGYLARVAFLIDRVMARVGLHGKAFVPLLSGFACAVPAVMATRTIESRRDRIATMLALPLMSCSARLPVYVLVIATIFSGEERVAGVFSPGALVLFTMYLVSTLATLGAAAVLRRTVLKGPRPALVLELPPYRRPEWRTLLRSTWERVRSFLVDAGTIILAISIVLWALLTYPKSEEVHARYEAQRSELASVADESERASRLEQLDAAEAGEQIRKSAAGRVGLAIEPVLQPLGFDWRIGVGIIGAFAAREVFVSTLATVFGISAGDEDATPVREALANASHTDGRKLMTPLAGLSLMLFFVFACQCMSTIAVVKRESGSWKWPMLMFGYMTTLAYVVSLAVYQLGSAFGWGLG